jgi:two-component system sensor histidine kinase HydH
MFKVLKLHRIWGVIPPWILIGAVALLLPIFTFTTLENINRQKENSIRLLLEKGAALIRSFEAGTRTGMMGMQWGGPQLQRLLTETAQQPDIDYLLVTDRNGTILAHDNPANGKHKHGVNLDLKSIADGSAVQWRVVAEPDGSKIFEVYRRFTPSRRPMGMHHGRMRLHRRSNPRIDSQGNTAPGDQIIFVGLDMDSIEEARRADTRHTVVMGIIFLLTGFAGIVLLFVTQSYRATKASLVQIKAFSDTLVENMPIGLLALDIQKQMASFNQVAGSLLRLSQKEFIGKNARQILPKELWRQIEKMDLESGIIEKEVDCVVGNGEIVPLEVSGTILKDENNTKLGYVLLFKDLSEVRALRKEIARSQRLASVGRLAAGVAHEIRNPLSSIKGFATYFRERYQDIKEDQEITKIMIQEVDRVNRVVSHLLEFARPIKITKKPTCLESLVKDSLKLVERQAAEKSVNITTRFPHHLHEMDMDPDRIKQVLLNLFLNAIESMTNGGILSVILSENAIRKGAQLRIADSGSGISKEDLPHIFDPYFTTKPSGTGLGLAIVHNIIEAHHGEIKVDSVPGQGTTFTIILPQ